MSEKIIKAFAAPTDVSPLITTAKIVKSESYSAGLDAAEILAAAHLQAQEIREEGERARYAIIEGAHKEGYEQGLQIWNDAIVEINAARAKYLAESESDLVRLAIRIARKIIGEELQASPETIVSITRECLRGTGREQFLKIRVAVAEVEVLRQRLDALREVLGPNRSIEVVPDPGVESGGCVVESEYGVIDAKLETQLRCMEETLLRIARKE